MDTYFAGSEIRLELPFALASGATVDGVTAVAYEITDSSGGVVLAASNLTPAPADNAHVLTLSAEQTALAAGVVRDVRVVRFSFEHGGATHTTYHEFYIEARDVLRLMQNSYQTYEHALLVARDVADIEGFNGATREQRITALVNAFHSLNTLNFFVTGHYYGDLGVVPAAEFQAMNARFQRAICTAQVIEANEFLSGDTIHKKRQAGLLSESIGESSMFWRPEKVLLIPVTRRSLDVLRGYVVWEMRTGRA
jgi:hypothetical protein